VLYAVDKDASDEHLQVVSRRQMQDGPPFTWVEWLANAIFNT